jgi:ABC-type ATPase with predicted acetyltransferase domain
MADIIPFIKRPHYASEDDECMVWECTECGSVLWIIAVDPVKIICGDCGLIREEESP